MEGLTCEHRDLVNVFETAVSFALETGPEVRDEDLSALVEVHCFAFERCFVSEAWKVVNDDVDQGRGGAGRFFDAS